MSLDRLSGFPLRGVGKFAGDERRLRFDNLLLPRFGGEAPGAVGAGVGGEAFEDGGDPAFGRRSRGGRQRGRGAARGRAVRGRAVRAGASLQAQLQLLHPGDAHATPLRAPALPLARGLPAAAALDEVEGGEAEELLLLLGHPLLRGASGAHGAGGARGVRRAITVGGLVVGVDAARRRLRLPLLRRSSHC